MSLLMPGPVAVPRLENGARLTRDEFERRYKAMPDLKKAELIEGVVYMSSPVRLVQHGSPHADLVWWLTSYRLATPGTIVGDNTSVRLGADNEPQPDGLLIIEPALGGQTHIDADGYLADGPEMVVEVSASTASTDRSSKLEVYCRNGVREYLVWRVEDNVIDWFVQRQGVRSLWCA